MSAPTPNDVEAALLNASLRIRAEVRRIRWLHGLLGEGTTLPAEVDQALKVLVGWARRVAAGTVPETHTPSAAAAAAAAAETVEPGPLAARPRPRHPMRRTGR